MLVIKNFSFLILYGLSHHSNVLQVLGSIVDDSVQYVQCYSGNIVSNAVGLLELSKDLTVASEKFIAKFILNNFKSYFACMACGAALLETWSISMYHLVSSFKWPPRPHLHSFKCSVQLLMTRSNICSDILAIASVMRLGG